MSLNNKKSSFEKNETDYKNEMEQYLDFKLTVCYGMIYETVNFRMLYLNKIYGFLFLRNI